MLKLGEFDLECLFEKLASPIRGGEVSCFEIMGKYKVLELCGGGGGQALGLEQAGFDHAAIVEFEPQFCVTLRTNRPHWNVIQQDIRFLRAEEFKGVDLIAAGVPCPPFSVAGRQLGADDERDMFPAALKIVEIVRPKAVLFENVPGLASAKFASYRANLFRKIEKLGYVPKCAVLHSANFGVPQLRPRFVLVGLRSSDAEYFEFPEPVDSVVYVGDQLFDLMAAGGWKGAPDWVAKAKGIAPTIVGGSKKHGGPDLGPTRAKRQWASLGVNGMGIADAPPAEDFPKDESPKLTVRMVARVQGFPDDWQFVGKKTIAYRQVGNAFPPPVARAIGESIISALEHRAPKITRISAKQLTLLEPNVRKRKQTKTK